MFKWALNFILGKYDFPNKPYYIIEASPNGFDVVEVWRGTPFDTFYTTVSSHKILHIAQKKLLQLQNDHR